MNDHDSPHQPVPERPRVPARAPVGASAPLLWVLGAILSILVIWALRQTAWITGTLALAFFAALALWPIDSWVRQHLPRGLRWIGHLAALFVLLLVFSIFVAGLMFIAQQVVTGLPQYESNIEQWVERLRQWGALAERQTGNNGTPVVDQLISPVMSMATTALQSIWSFGGLLTLLFFLVWLMLAETPSYIRKKGVMTSDHGGDMLDSIIRATAERFRRYLVVRAALGVMTGALYMAWIWWWGLDFVLVWGMLAVLLNFLPVVGSIIAGALPVVLAFLVRDPATALVIAIGLLVIEQLMGNYVDPKFQGRQLAISPLVVLVALLFWGWVWGLLGAVLAVPMTLIFIIACSRFESLRPIALALSNVETEEDLEEATTP